MEYINSRTNQKKGIDSSLDEQQLKRMYSKFIEEKKDALSMPLRPYVVKML